ncbi:MAG: S-layer homology domain-containing protein, partial [Clostridiales Family XIII bacterium]|nr:S-layer homology domain-containing protein [Clostridiales Family XIII bacterium]
MNKSIRKAFALCVAVLLIAGTAPVYAYSDLTASATVLDHAVTVSGATTQNTFVSLLVLRDADSERVYADQTKSDAQGAYSVGFTLDNGSYRAVVTSNGLQRTAVFTVPSSDTGEPGTPGTTPDPDNSIRVTFRLIGATLASEDVNINLGVNDSKYVTWISTKTYAMREGDSNLDLFLKATGDAGMRSNITFNNNYVATVYAPAVLGGYALSEFTNGSWSGWMYTVNGVHVGYGLKEQMLRNGDTIIWHYVNDYRYEVHDWFPDLDYPSLATDSTYYNKWLLAPDRDPTAADAAGTPGGTTDNTPATEIKTEESLGGAGGGTAKVEVKGEDVTAAVDKAKEDKSPAVSVTVKGDANTKVADVVLPKSSAKEIADGGLEFVVKSPVGDVSFGEDALNTIAARPGDTLEVVIADEGRTETIETNNKTFTLTVKVDDAELTALGGAVAVALPYAKAASEDAELLTVYKLEEDGTYTEIKDAKYNTATGKADFTTTETGSYFVSEWISPFSDISKGAWYYKAVRYAYASGLMNGTGDGAYSPQATLTRAMLITILAREAGVDTDGGDTWYSKAIEWGTESGVTDGTNPDGEITREQFAAMLYRYADSPRTSGGFDAYDDAGDVSAWAEEAMAWAVESGLITGRT